VKTSRGELGVLDDMVKANTESINGYITALRELITGPLKLEGFTDIAQSFFKTLYDMLAASDIPENLGRMVAEFLIMLRNNLPNIIGMLDKFTNQSSALWGVLESGVIILNSLAGFLNALPQWLSQGALGFFLMSKAFGLTFNALTPMIMGLNAAVLNVNKLGLSMVQSIRTQAEFRKALATTAMGVAQVSGAAFMMGMIAQDAGQVMVNFALLLVTQVIPALISLFVATQLSVNAKYGLGGLILAGTAIGLGLGYMYGESERAKAYGQQSNYNINQMNVYSQDADEWADALRNKSGGAP
jgi:hypothetical protein